MGYDELLTGHGIRATISTGLNEIGYPKVWVDAQLSHCDPNKVSGAYNHALYVEPRRRMMQDWADRLDLLEQGQVQRASSHLTIRFDGVPISDSDEVSEKNKKAINEITELPTTQFQRLLSIPKKTKPKPIVPLTTVQREQMEMLQIYESPYNLPAVRFAKLAGKSRDQIHREISAGELLVLKIGNRGQRIPDWQLDPIKNRLTSALKSEAHSFDAYRLYRVLTQKYELLNGRSLVEIVTADNFEEVMAAARTMLHIGKNE